MEKPVGYRECTRCGSRYAATLAMCHAPKALCQDCEERNRRYREMLATAEQGSWRTCARCRARYNPKRQDVIGCPACAARKRRRLETAGVIVGLLYLAAGLSTGVLFGPAWYLGGGIMGTLIGLFIGVIIADASQPGRSGGS